MRRSPPSTPASPPRTLASRLAAAEDTLIALAEAAAAHARRTEDRHAALTVAHLLLAITETHQAAEAWWRTVAA